MPDMNKEKLSINVNIKITTDALRAIVTNAKLMAPKDDDGTYHVDTADFVSTMISRFLEEKDFESFVMNIENYALG